MDTVRLARDLGNVSGLLPRGIERLRDIPFPLAQAIRAALRFLSWEENLDEKDMPPRSRWLDSEWLVEHFEGIRRRNTERADGRGIENPVQNDAARMLIVG